MRLQGGVKRLYNPTINNNITRFKLNYIWIEHEALTQMALRLPSLKRLTTENCIFIDKTGKSPGSPANINMPDTTLDTLTLIWPV